MEKRASETKLEMTSEIVSGATSHVTSQVVSETYKLHRRFDRLGRLVGDQGMSRLINSHVMVIGLGGVGSWAVESLVRSGVGRLTIVDFDEICITNTNRQVHALSGLVGKKKAQILGDRMRQVNPQCQVDSKVIFYNKDNCTEIFRDQPDYVVDAIDNITAKCHLINHCRENQIPMVISAGSGGRLDPTQVEVRDLAFTELDPMARAVRKILRSKYGFPGEGSFNIPTVFSKEPIIMPIELHYDGGKGFTCVCPQGANDLHSCDNRNLIMGSAGFVTGAFGFACASVVIRGLLTGKTEEKS